MKYMIIVLIVYGISWFILLAVKIITSLFNKNRDSSENVPWYMYAILIAFAPLALLIVASSLIYEFITEKKEKKAAKYAIIIATAPLSLLVLAFLLVSSLAEKIETKKREKREAKEKAYKQRAMQELYAAMSKPQEDHSFVHAMTAQTLVGKINEKDYDSFMQYLDHLSLPEGASLHVEECSHEGHGDESKLFVETSEGEIDFNIWDYIKADNSIDGAWEAFFLSKAKHILPLWWHANYNSRTYMYSKEDTDSIQLFSKSKEQLPIIQRNVKRLISAPEVIDAANGKYYVRCCYWTNFGGLIKETVQVLISAEGKVSFNDIEGTTLYHYKCGVFF